MRVLIVGAGPTGLTAAVELARLGIRADVVERRPGASPLSRAVGILKSTMEILTPSGVAADVDAEAVHVTGMVMHDGARPVAAMPLNFDETSRMWCLAQDRTEAHLAAALRRLGGDVRYGTAVEELTQTDAAVEATCGGKTESYDYVVGADGSHSMVREAVGIPFDGIDLPERWGIADVEAPGWRDPQKFQGFLMPEGEIVVVVPLEAARFRVIASEPDALSMLPVPMPVQRIRNSGSFIIPVRQVPSYRKGRVFLAGDAAHCHSPIGGRGMNLGIADAADLARRLAKGETEGYHAARHAAGAATVKLSETARKMLQAKDAPRRWLVRNVLGTASHIPPLARAMVRRLVSA